MVTNERVAIKKVSKVFENLTDARRTLREIKLMQHLEHDNVVKIKEVLRPSSLEEFEDVYVVYELMDMDLSNLLRSPQQLSTDHCLVFMEQVGCERTTSHIHTDATV
jgi:mitogen-activated protein kinase 1/3